MTVEKYIESLKISINNKQILINEIFKLSSKIFNYYREDVLLNNTFYELTLVDNICSLVVYNSFGKYVINIKDIEEELNLKLEDYYTLYQTLLNIKNH